MSNITTAGTTITRKPVYDILNCGPRHRFVVRGKSGPMIVHNCIQALTGRLINQSMLDIDKELGGSIHGHKGAVVHQVHDEIIAVCREQDADDVSAMMDEVMTHAPGWAPGLPLAVEGGASYVYDK
jgi:DNA polymerase I-like protein with 3'-5' exonuclease and polymerase domains